MKAFSVFINDRFLNQKWISVSGFPIGANSTTVGYTFASSWRREGADCDIATWAYRQQSDGMPVWFDGKSINEVLFCEEFLQTHKILFTNGAFFTPEGRVTDELPLRGEIFEGLKCCAVSNTVELMKLAALVEDFPPKSDHIHLSDSRFFWTEPLRRESRKSSATASPCPTTPTLRGPSSGCNFWME